MATDDPPMLWAWAPGYVLLIEHCAVDTDVVILLEVYSYHCLPISVNAVSRYLNDNSFMRLIFNQPFDMLLHQSEDTMYHTLLWIYWNISCCLNWWLQKSIYYSVWKSDMLKHAGQVPSAQYIYIYMIYIYIYATLIFISTWQQNFQHIYDDDMRRNISTHFVLYDDHQEQCETESNVSN